MKIPTTSERKLLRDGMTIHILCACSIRDIAEFLGRTATQARAYVRNNNLAVTREWGGKVYHGDVVLPDQKFNLSPRGRRRVSVS